MQKKIKFQTEPNGDSREKWRPCLNYEAWILSVFYLKHELKVLSQSVAIDRFHGKWRDLCLKCESKIFFILFFSNNKIQLSSKKRKKGKKKKAYTKSSLRGLKAKISEYGLPNQKVLTARLRAHFKFHTNNLTRLVYFIGNQFLIHLVKSQFVSILILITT